MTDASLTTDETLRALAALEAIAGSDDTALTALRAPGERPLPDLLATYGQHTLQRLLMTAFGIDATTGPDEMTARLAELNADQQAQLVFILIDTLRKEARLHPDDPGAAKIIGAAVLSTLETFLIEDTATVLGMLRQQILQRDQPAD